MRYEVGQRVPFISQFFHTKNWSNEWRFEETGGRAFKPWEDINLIIEVELMTCVAHHRVPESWDPAQKPACDGFIFHGYEQSVWHNQYPRASYGQLDDSNDRRLHPAEFTEETAWLVRVDAREAINTVLRGIRYFKGNGDFGTGPKIEPDPHKCKQLNDHKDLLLRTFQEKTGIGLSVRPMVARFTDGRPPETIANYLICTMPELVEA